MKVHTIGEIGAECFTRGPIRGVLLSATIAEIRAISQLLGEAVTIVPMPDAPAQLGPDDQNDDPNGAESFSTIDLILALRGGEPDKCDWCGNVFEEGDRFFPEEAGEWVCAACCQSE